MTVARKVLAEYRIGKTVGEGAFSKVKLALHKSSGEKVAIKIISKKRLELSFKKKEAEKVKRKKREDARKKRDAEKKEKERAAEAAKAVEEGGEETKAGPSEPKPEEVAIVPNRPLTQKQKKKVLEEEARKKNERDEELRETLPGHFSTALSKEIRLLQVLEHPNIIRLYQVIETEQDYYIVTQYAAGGEIIDFISKRRHLNEKTARKFFRQIISAVDHCHTCGVLHRDLKLENILLSEEGDILISDFGLGRTFQVDNLCGTFCGTPLYAAPELVSGIRYSGPPADAWAMGVVLYAMIVGRPPFQADTMSDLYKKIKTVDYKMPNCSDSLKDFLRKIFVKNTQTRITVSEMRNHPWIMETFDEPPARQPAEKIIKHDGQSIENCKAIQFESNAMFYQFREIPNTPKVIAYNASVTAPDARLMKTMENVTLDPPPWKKALPLLPRLKSYRHNQIYTNPQNKIFSDYEMDLVSQEQLHIPQPLKPVVYKIQDETDEESRKYLIPLMRAYEVANYNHTSHNLMREKDTVNTEHFTFGSSKPRAPPKVHRRHSITHEARPIILENERQDYQHIKIFRSPSARLTLIENGSDSGEDINPIKRRSVSYSSRLSSNQNSNSIRPHSTGGGRSSVSEFGKKVPLSRVSDTELPSPTRSSSGGTIPLAAASTIANKKIKVLKGGFNLPITSSEFSPAELLEQIQTTLTFLNLKYTVVDEFTISCIYNSSAECVEIDIEVVKIWLLNVHGIRLRRKSGSHWLYKNIYDSIVSGICSSSDQGHTTTAAASTTPTTPAITSNAKPNGVENDVSDSNNNDDNNNSNNNNNNNNIHNGNNSVEAKTLQT